MRFVFLLVIAVLVLSFSGLIQTQSPSATTRSYGEARIGGAFTLTDTHGNTVKDSDFRGKLMLVYLGYSHCPDICPMTLATISESLNALGKDADNLAPLFISVDPERDSPAALAQFLSSFDPRIIGLTGDRQAIDQTAQAYKTFHRKVVTPNTGSYLIDHSGFLFLMDRQGKYLRHFDADVKPGELAQAIRSYF